MARNEEKAMAMLNRWVKMKRGLNTVDKGKRPKNPEECMNVAEADNWRKQIVRELIKKVSDI
jgi:pre-mRNA-splicing factor ISY1